MRPLGAALFGTVADRVGRRAVMLGSVGLMAVAALVIAVIPTYSAIGIWSPLILLVCLLLQGLSTGIEAPLSTAYAVELSPAGREGRAAGLISLYVNVGILLASLASFFTSLIVGASAMEDWGWRVPFAIGAVLGLTALYMRRALPETLHTESGEVEPSAGAVWRGVGRHWLALLAILFVVGAAQAYNYAWNVGLPSLARSTFHEDPTAVFALTSVLGLLLVVGAPLSGAMADRRRLSWTFVVTRLLAVPAVFLMLAYTGHGLVPFGIVLLGGGIVLVLNMTLYNVVSTSLLPKSIRATGVGLGYGVAVALFGGTASYLLVWLEEQHKLWVFPLYTAVLALISVPLYLAARRRTGLHAGE
jgi:MFS transporter, MHS family, alpha-ketoglutarate permease